jgi:hypothetical protein
MESAWESSREFRERLDLRNRRTLEASAVLGITPADARQLVRQFETRPDERRSDDCLQHCAAVLGERAGLTTVYADAVDARCFSRGLLFGLAIVLPVWGLTAVVAIMELAR